jgi:hypothetical protein
MTEKPEDNVWIDAPLSSVGIDPKFYGMATVVAHPYGQSGPAVASVKFNLTAYVKHLIERSAEIS